MTCNLWLTRKKVFLTRSNPVIIAIKYYSLSQTDSTIRNIYYSRQPPRGGGFGGADVAYTLFFHFDLSICLSSCSPNITKTARY